MKKRLISTILCISLLGVFMAGCGENKNEDLAAVEKLDDKGEEAQIVVEDEKTEEEPVEEIEEETEEQIEGRGGGSGKDREKTEMDGSALRHRQRQSLR